MNYKVGDKVRLLGTKNFDNAWDKWKKHLNKGDIVTIQEIQDGDFYFFKELNGRGRFLESDFEPVPKKPSRFDILNQKLGGT